jgi:hypothetical protein
MAQRGRKSGSSPVFGLTLFPSGGRGKREAAHRQPLSHSSPKTGLEWGTQQFLPVWQILWCTRWTHFRIGKFSHRLFRAGLTFGGPALRASDPWRFCSVISLSAWVEVDGQGHDTRFWHSSDRRGSHPRYYVTSNDSLSRPRGKHGPSQPGAARVCRCDRSG